LILEVPVLELRTAYQSLELLGFCDVAGKRLLAGNADQLGLALNHRLDHFLDVLDPRVVRATEPNGVDLGVRNHVPNHPVGFAVADVERLGVAGGALGVFSIRAEDSEHVRVPDSQPGQHVKTGVEPAADEADAETVLGHAGRSGLIVNRGGNGQGYGLVG